MRPFFARWPLCRILGCTSLKRGKRSLAVHHRVPENNNTDLMITLCLGHHAMPEIVTTTLSFFEVEIEFVEPNIKLWIDRVAIVEAVYAALRQWKITVDDI